MKFIKPEIIDEIKKIDLLTYLENTNPDEIVRVSAGNYCTKTHDSLKISNNKWMWFSRGIGGRNALSYLISVKGMNFFEAATELCKFLGREPGIDVSPEIKGLSKPESREKVNTIPFCIPEKDNNNDKVVNYLKGRGISENVINYCIDRGLIYQRKYGSNMVFIGTDEKNIPRYAGIREISGGSFRGDIMGSNKKYAFKLKSDSSDRLHIFEGVTDLLSYATLLEMDGVDFRKENMLALSGIYSPVNKEVSTKIPAAIDMFVSFSPIKEICLHLDNDEAGRKAAKGLSEVLSERFRVYDVPPEKGKDVNEYLCSIVHPEVKSPNISKEGKNENEILSKSETDQNR